MKKGDIVRINFIVRGESGLTKRELRRYKLHGGPFTGIVLGYSSIKTGDIIRGNYYDEPNYLKTKDSHSVIVVEPIEQNNTWWGKRPFATNRYLEPVRCFEEDLELVD